MQNTIIKKQLLLDGLDCANCAAKIEHQIKALDVIENAYINFLNKTLIIEFYSNKDINTILNKINNIVTSHEPHVIVKEVDKTQKTKEKQTSFEISKSKAIFFILGAAIFFVALVFKLPFWGEVSLFLISYLLIGKDVILSAGKNILKGQVFDENFLMSIASIGAFAIGEFPEGVAVMLFYQIGEFFQDLAVNNSRKSITALMDIRPDYANLQVGADIKKVDPLEIKIDDIILIKPGEKVPLDGIVLNGNSTLDTLALTGESLPREISEGDEILSGMININGLLTVKVTKLFEDSTVSKILDLVQNASGKKAKTENFITKFARIYTPVVVILAVLLGLVPPIFGFGSFSEWINRALVFLVVSCPCALVLSVPLSYFSGIGAASKNGVLIKGSNYLEALTNVDTVVFDKTGTLTKGVFKVTKIENKENHTKENILKYAAFAESFSNHPIAVSILKEYDGDIDKEQIEAYQEISGYGVKIKLQGKEIFVGNKKLMEKENIVITSEKQIGTVVYVAVDGVYVGYILISDEIKIDSINTVSKLREFGMKKLVMLSGDNKEIAESIGKQVGLDEVYSELLPDQKVEILEKIKGQSDAKVLFVGDGINDAPVIAMADVGVAMGGLGSDAAIEASDVVIMNDQPYKIVNMIKIAKKTKKIVWQNIIFSLFVKALVLVLGAMGIATMWGAVFADVGVALIAVLNAARAMRI